MKITRKDVLVAIITNVVLLLGVHITGIMSQGVV